MSEHLTSGEAGDPELLTARLALEPLRPDDAGEMVAVLADPRLYEFIGGRPPTLDELRDRFALQARGRSPDGTQEWRNWIARVRLDGTAVGTVQATITEGGRVADIAWVIGAPWQGQGYATEATRAIVAWLDARGILAITAHIHPGHRASAAVAERVGLVPTGELEDGEQVWRRAMPSPGPPMGGNATGRTRPAGIEDSDCVTEVALVVGSSSDSHQQRGTAMMHRKWVRVAVALALGAATFVIVLY